MTDRSNWNMSRIRASQAPRERKVHAPVGTRDHCEIASDYRCRKRDLTCGDCGYHVCSCARPQAHKPAESTGIVWEDHPPKPSTGEYNFPIRVSLEDGRLPSQIQLERDARGCHAYACTCPECTYG